MPTQSKQKGIRFKSSEARLVWPVTRLLPKCPRPTSKAKPKDVIPHARDRPNSTPPEGSQAGMTNGPCHEILPAPQLRSGLRAFWPAAAVPGSRAARHCLERALLSHSRSAPLGALSRRHGNQAPFPGGGRRPEIMYGADSTPCRPLTRRLGGLRQQPRSGAHHKQDLARELLRQQATDGYRRPDYKRK